MSKHYFLLLSCIFIICNQEATSTTFSSYSSYSSLFAPKEPLLNAYATKYGRIPLLKDDFGGFYLSVDLKDDSDDASDSEFGPDTVPMFLGLYTSQTLLASECLNLGFYDCDYYKCLPNETSFTGYEFPYFQADGYFATADMYLDYNYWKLHKLSNAAIAISCTSQRSELSGIKKFGILGMGTRENAKNNFLKSSNSFSIYIKRDLLDGLLLFENDFAYAQSKKPLSILKTDEDWVVRNGVENKTSIHIQNLDVVSQFDLIFDIGFSGIGLPLNIYFGVISALEEVSNLKCNSVYSFASCTYHGRMISLPNIIINVSSSILVIPPETYVKRNEPSNSILQLNLIGMSSILSEVSFITPRFNNCVILGAELMSLYYTVFNISDHSIVLYGSRIEIEGQKWLIILIECILFISFVIGAWACCHFLNKTKRPVTKSIPAQTRYTSHVALLAPDSPSIRQALRNSHVDSPKIPRTSIFSFNAANNNNNQSSSHNVQIKSAFAK